MLALKLKQHEVSFSILNSIKTKLNKALQTTLLKVSVEKPNLTTSILISKQFTHQTS